MSDFEDKLLVDYLSKYELAIEHFVWCDITGGHLKSGQN